MSEYIVELKSVTKTYISKRKKIPVLKNLNLNFKKNEMVAIVGKSGLGKTTLLNIISLMDFPSNGQCFIDGKDTSTFNNKELAATRNNSIGYIIQDFGLIDNYTVYQNLLLLYLYNTDSNKNRKAFEKKVDNLLENFNIYDKKHERCVNLSGGQKQRTAIIRALLNNPLIILADEPTSSLDEENKQYVMKKLREINQTGVLVIISTHDNEVAQKCDRIYNM